VALQSEEIARIEAALSAERFATYLRAAGRDRDRAVRLYLWNIDLATTLYFPLQITEVVSRNAIHLRLSLLFGKYWPTSTAFHATLNAQGKKTLMKAHRRAGGFAAPVGKIIAELPFDFWAGLTNPRHERDIWQSGASAVFRAAPNNSTRADIHDRLYPLKSLRNRIGHHEPLIGYDSSTLYGEMLIIIRWSCPTTADWVRSHCRLHDVMRQRP
jgi:hypothetical protein